MADFDIEFDKVILAEGGYVNDPNDAGGETYLGISRKNNPKWKGWSIIDSIKKTYGTKNINTRLKKQTTLLNYAKDLYKEKYWNCMFLDEIPNQDIAHQLFDTGVNCGISTAIKLAQNCCNIAQTGKWSNELKNKLIAYG